MKLKLFLPFAFFMFLNALNAQIMYSDEEIKKKYDHETMTLTLNGVEKNGILSRFNYLFPSKLMQEEMEKNGSSEANKAYKDYKKTITFYWIASILGIIAIFAVGFGILIPAATAATTASAWNSAFLLYMLVAMGIGAAIAFLGKKAFRLLAHSIWLYNRHVLLKK
jgi:hypothetical protein